MTKMNMLAVGVLALACVGTPDVASAEPQQSVRLQRAKDFIADEQWERAIEQLKTAAADAKERNRDEALFWLAHSQHQARDLAAAVQTIADLERRFPASPWVKPARSLRIEIAQKLRRHDVLWMTAQPAPAPAPPAPAASGGRRPAPPPAPPALTPPQGQPPTARVAPPRPAPAPAPTPFGVWMPQEDPDTSLRIQALGSLMRTDAARVIPILKEIALQSPDPDEAGRAIFVLAQSGRADAHSTVLDVARHGSESVQIAAVRELGRFGGDKVSEQLLQVYGTGNPRVKYQIVNALGEREATTALVRIVENESDRRLRETAIVRLGQAGAREQLQRFYGRANAELKQAIIVGLFNARGDEELIRIAEQEKDESVRRAALTRLRLLNTAKARAYLERLQKR